MWTWGNPRHLQYEKVFSEGNVLTLACMEFEEFSGNHFQECVYLSTWWGTFSSTRDLWLQRWQPFVHFFSSPPLCHQHPDSGQMEGRLWGKKIFRVMLASSTSITIHHVCISVLPHEGLLMKQNTPFKITTMDITERINADIKKTFFTFIYTADIRSKWWIGPTIWPHVFWVGAWHTPWRLTNTWIKHLRIDSLGAHLGWSVFTFFFVCFCWEESFLFPPGARAHAL